LIQLWTKVIKVKVTLPGILKTENVFFFFGVTLFRSKSKQKLVFFWACIMNEGSKRSDIFFSFSSSDYTILDNDFYLISTKISEGGNRGAVRGFVRVTVTVVTIQTYQPWLVTKCNRAKFLAQFYGWITDRWNNRKPLVEPFLFVCLFVLLYQRMNANMSSCVDSKSNIGRYDWW